MSLELRGTATHLCLLKLWLLIYWLVVWLVMLTCTLSGQIVLGVWACTFLHTVSWVSNSFQELDMFQEADRSIPLFKEEKALSFALLRVELI